MRKMKRHKGPKSSPLGKSRASHDGVAPGEVRTVTKKASPVYERQAKKPQRDDPPANSRPIAHHAVETKKAGARRALLKRLGHQKI